MKKRVTIDFESRSRANLKKTGAYKYALDPSTQPTCLAIKLHGQKPFLMPFGEINKHWKDLPTVFHLSWERLIREGVLFSAHNAFFEQCIYNLILVARLGWPKIPPHLWRCTAAKAAACALPRSLEKAGAALKLLVQKDLNGRRIMLKLCKPRKDGAFWEPHEVPEDFAAQDRYCIQDTIVEEMVDDALPDLSPQEQELWFHDQLVNSRGIYVDLPVVKKIISMREKETAKMMKEADSLTTGFLENINSRNQILEYLATEGFELPNLQSKTVEEYLTNGRINGDAKRILEIRKALSKSSTKKYDAFLNRACQDRRVRDNLLFHGASTGRWGGLGVQPQNFPRGFIKDTDGAIEEIETYSTEDLKFLYGENLSPLFSSCLRGMFMATPGKKLFVADYSAVETRALWWLAGDEKGLDSFRRGLDVYRVQAAEVYESTYVEIEDPSPERQLGKALILACGFGMGPEKFVETCHIIHNLPIDAELGAKAVKAFRESHASVTKFWKSLNDAAIYAVDNPGKRARAAKIVFVVEGKFLCMIIPSGRKLRYAYPTVDWTVTKWGSSVRSLVYWAVNPKSKKWNEERTYGGKLAENATQAVARDLLAESLLTAEAKGYEVLMHSHDEIVSEAVHGSVDEFEKIMETLPSWAKGLPLKAKGWTGPRYKK